MTTNNPISPEKVRALLQSMVKSIDEWREDEPQEDWWTYQRDHAEAAALIEAQERAYLALSERVAALEREIEFCSGSCRLHPPLAQLKEEPIK